MTSALLPLLPAFVLMVIGAALAVVLRHPSVRGRIGEHQVERALRALDANEYRVFNDVILPSLDGTTQIDHVVISRYGVFVIETKNLGGLIVGGARDAQWTQCRGRRRYPFQNPLRQNYRHAKALETALGLSAREVIPLLVFTGDCRVHPSLSRQITPLAALPAEIARRSAPLYAEDRRDELCQRLDCARIDGQPDARRAHVAALRKRQGGQR